MILITGATGYIGRHVVARLMAAGLPLRCLLPVERLRDIPWDELDPSAPDVIIGHLLDDEAVFKAVTGVHTIIHLENAMWWGRERELERIEISGTRNLIALARSARVGRIIAISHLGAAPSSAYTLHRIKGQVEELVRASGLAYTILRSGMVYGPEDAFINHIAMMLSTNPLLFFMPGQGEVVLHPMHIDDLTRVIEHSLESVELVDQLVEVGGAEYITLRDLILTVMRVARMRRLVISLPPYLMRFITFLYSYMFPRSLMTPQWLDVLATHRAARLGNTFEYFGFQPRRFEDSLLLYMPYQRYWWRALRYSFRRRPRGL